MVFCSSPIILERVSQWGEEQTSFLLSFVPSHWIEWRDTAPYDFSPTRSFVACISLRRLLSFVVDWRMEIVKNYLFANCKMTKQWQTKCAENGVGGGRDRNYNTNGKEYAWSVQLWNVTYLFTSHVNMVPFLNRCFDHFKYDNIYFYWINGFSCGAAFLGSRQ